MFHFVSDGEANWDVGTAFSFAPFPQEKTKFGLPLAAVKFSFAWEKLVI